MKKGRFTTSEEVAIRDTLDSFRGVRVSHSSILRSECAIPRRMASRARILLVLSTVNSEPNMGDFGKI